MHSSSDVPAQNWSKERSTDDRNHGFGFRYWHGVSTGEPQPRNYVFCINSSDGGPSLIIPKLRCSLLNTKQMRNNSSQCTKLIGRGGACPSTGITDQR